MPALTLALALALRASHTVWLTLSVPRRLWGMPIGEFFDLEALSKECAETGRYTFFFSSWPLNM